MSTKASLLWTGAALLLGFVGGVGAGLRSTGDGRSLAQLAGEVPYGACAALETARAEKLLEPEAVSRLYQDFLDIEEKSLRTYNSEFHFRREDRACPQILQARKARLEKLSR